MPGYGEALTLRPGIAAAGGAVRLQDLDTMGTSRGDQQGVARLGEGTPVPALAEPAPFVALERRGEQQGAVDGESFGLHRWGSSGWWSLAASCSRRSR
jgi:hypothetical protein